MDDFDVPYNASPQDTMCDRAAIIIQMAAQADATSNPAAQALLIKTMEAVYATLVPRIMVKDGNVVPFTRNT